MDPVLELDKTFLVPGSNIVSELSDVGVEGSIRVLLPSFFKSLLVIWVLNPHGFELKCLVLLFGCLEV